LEEKPQKVQRKMVVEKQTKLTERRRLKISRIRMVSVMIIIYIVDKVENNRNLFKYKNKETII